MRAVGDGWVVFHVLQKRNEVTVNIEEKSAVENHAQLRNLCTER